VWLILPLAAWLTLLLAALLTLLLAALLTLPLAAWLILPLAVWLILPLAARLILALAAWLILALLPELLSVLPELLSTGRLVLWRALLLLFQRLLLFPRLLRYSAWGEREGERETASELRGGGWGQARATLRSLGDIWAENERLCRQQCALEDQIDRNRAEARAIMEADDEARGFCFRDAPCNLGGKCRRPGCRKYWRGTR
jgi:hypothetical protein